MDVVFLGINDIGWDIYTWLCDRDSTTVHGMITTEEQLDMLKRYSPDYAVACGFTHIVSPEYLDTPEQGCINVHPGYLPDTRGYNPNVWSIVENHTPGATIHYMDEGIDTGDILDRKQVSKSFEDTGKTLYTKIENAAVELFKETWPDVEAGTVERISQDDNAGALHLKNDFQDLCEIDPDQTYRAKELLNVLRALTFPPFDNAFVELNDEKYYIDIDIRRGTTDSETEDLSSEY